MPIVLAPLEVILVLVGLGLVFWLFRKSLNSKKLDNVIEEVIHPEVHTLDGASEGLDRARATAAEALVDSTEAAERRRLKEDRLRNLYGGGSNL